MNHMRGKILLFTVMAATALLAACGGGGGGGGSSAAQEGTLRVSITDAPACGFDEVNVTVSKVRVHQSANASPSDPGWSDITLNPARKINLLSLTNGVLLELGQTPLPAGHYTQLRLVLTANSVTPLANSVVPSGGRETALSTPSDVESGIKLINEFDVAANTLVDLVLDVDACKSVVTRGNGGFLLKPVIRVIPRLVSGAITGFVDRTLAASQPVVTAQLNSIVVASTVPDPQTGAFTLSPLIESSTAGDYDVVFTAVAHASAVISGVPVTAGATTAVSGSGGATPPVTLGGSPTRTVSGTVMPVSAEATVRATQTFPAGPKVEIAANAADLATGFYSLSLPAAAPSLGQFGAGTLPITLTATPAVAGVYGIEASTPGSATQSATVDISSGDVVHDFSF